MKDGSTTLSPSSITVRSAVLAAPFKKNEVMPVESFSDRRHPGWGAHRPGPTALERRANGLQFGAHRRTGTSGFERCRRRTRVVAVRLVDPCHGSVEGALRPDPRDQLNEGVLMHFGSVGDSPPAPRSGCGPLSGAFRSPSRVWPRLCLDNRPPVLAGRKRRMELTLHRENQPVLGGETFTASSGCHSAGAGVVVQR